MKKQHHRDKQLVIKDLDEQEFKFSGYLSTYGNADRVGDVIEKGAFDKSISNKAIVPMLSNHNRDEVIGKLVLSSDEKGLKVDGYINPEIPKAVEVYSNLKFGALVDMSVGMQIKDFDPIDSKDPWGAWNIKQADVLEGSIVSIPANPQATIEQVKSYEEKKVINTIKKEIKNLLEKER